MLLALTTWSGGLFQSLFMRTLRVLHLTDCFTDFFHFHGHKQENSGSNKMLFKKHLIVFVLFILGYGLIISTFRPVLSGRVVRAVG